ncbi:MAG: hypothetical protein JNK12_01280 [Acidimicrobiales bacterium]|nr:hypothetical protein [Acidimicrobiales bacterium]
MRPRTRRQIAATALLAVTASVVGIFLGTTAVGAEPQVPADGRVSVDSNEGQADDTVNAAATSTSPDISADGRFVVFTSRAADLVAGDTNETEDVYLRDRLLGTTERISVDSAEVGANGASTSPAISDDGRLVVFHSLASNLVASDTNGAFDIFLRDRQAGTTVKLSSGFQIFINPHANGSSTNADISGNGTVVAFESDASNIISGDGNGVRDIFVRTLATGTVVRASVANDESESNANSFGAALDQDGDVVAFQSDASDLIGVNDTNAVRDVYARRLATGTTFRVSVDSNNDQALQPSFVPSVSDDGLSFAFETDADLVPADDNGLRDVYVRKPSANQLTYASMDTGGGAGNGLSSAAVISGDATRVAFDSEASDLVAADANGAGQDVFVRTLTGSPGTVLYSARPGTVVEGGSEQPVIADNGIVAFDSTATNLVANDTNGRFDVFVAGEVCDGRVVDVDLNQGDVPTANADVILGTPGADTVDGLAGADRFCGGNGDDVFRGGLGADRAFGGQGSDKLSGDDGKDVLEGNGGNDILKGGAGNDAMKGGTGLDTCKGQTGTDTASTCETRVGIP